MSCRGVICLLGFLQRLLGNNNAKEIKKMRAIADHINEIEPNYVKLSDANLVAKTDEFKRRLQKGKRWTTYCQKHLLSFVKHLNAYWVCVILTYS